MDQSCRGLVNSIRIGSPTFLGKAYNAAQSCNYLQNPTGPDEETGVVSSNYSYIDSFRRSGSRKEQTLAVLFRGRRSATALVQSSLTAGNT
jgi:hypothetical protein